MRPGGPPFSPAFHALSAAVARACGIEQPPEPGGPVDWNELLALADRQRVAGLAALGGVKGAPPDVLAALDARRERQVLASLHIAALQRRVLATLREAGVRATVLKGLPLSVDAYGDPAARGQRDVDVLIERDAAARAVDALLAAGLRWYGWPRSPGDPDSPPLDRSLLEHLARLPMLRDVGVTGDTGILVELHWRLFENPHLMHLPTDWLAQPHTTRVHGDEIPTLPPDAHLAYALVHGTRHSWSTLKWLADVPALVVRRPELADADLLRAAAPGNDRALATGWIVAERVFGRFLPPEPRRWAEAVPGTRGLVRRSLWTLAAPLAPPGIVTPRALPKLVVARMALRPDAAYRLAEVRLLLLAAGRAQGVLDPGSAQLLAGPIRWVRRTLRRRRDEAEQ